MKFEQLVLLIVHEVNGLPLLPLDYPHLAFLIECEPVVKRYGAASSIDDIEVAVAELWDLLNSLPCFKWVASLNPAVKDRFLSEETVTIDSDVGPVYYTASHWKM